MRNAQMNHGFRPQFFFVQFAVNGSPNPDSVVSKHHFGHVYTHAPGSVANKNEGSECVANNDTQVNGDNSSIQGH